MAKFHIPTYAHDDRIVVSDLDLVCVLNEIIDDSMVENGIYLHDDDRAHAVEIIYPIISSMFFNSHFTFLRSDKTLLLDLVKYLVTRLS